MNESNCSNDSRSFSSSERNRILVAAATSGTCSLLFCTLAVSILIALRLYKHLVYRLAMYQMFGAGLLGLSNGMLFMLYGYSDNLYYHVSCKFTAFFTQYCTWVEIIFTGWLTFHLFCYIIYFKNFKRLECLYIASAIVVPMLFNWIPFINDSYDLSGAWCFIHSSKEDNCTELRFIEGIVEQFVLFYGPATIFLALQIIAVSTIFAVLLRRVCKSSASGDREPLYDKNKYFQVIKQLLPLLAYPIIYSVCFLSPLINRLYGAASDTNSYKLTVIHGVVYHSSGVFAALALMVHIGMIKCRKKATHTHQLQDKGYSTFEGVTPYTSGAATQFSLPYESQIDDNLT